MIRAISSSTMRAMAGGLRPLAQKDITPARPHSPGHSLILNSRGAVYNPTLNAQSKTMFTFQPVSIAQARSFFTSQNVIINEKTSSSTPLSQRTVRFSGSLVEKVKSHGITANGNYGGGTGRSQLGRDGGKVQQYNAAVYKGK